MMFAKTCVLIVNRFNPSAIAIVAHALELISQAAI